MASHVQTKARGRCAICRGRGRGSWQGAEHTAPGGRAAEWELNSAETARGAGVSSLRDTSALLAQAQGACAVGSDPTGTRRPPQTDISGRTTQWPQRGQRLLHSPCGCRRFVPEPGGRWGTAQYFSTSSRERDVPSRPRRPTPLKIRCGVQHPFLKKCLHPFSGFPMRTRERASERGKKYFYEQRAGCALEEEAPCPRETGPTTREGVLRTQAPSAAPTQRPTRKPSKGLKRAAPSRQENQPAGCLPEEGCGPCWPVGAPRPGRRASPHWAPSPHCLRRLRGRSKARLPPLSTPVARKLKKCTCLHRELSTMSPTKQNPGIRRETGRELTQRPSSLCFCFPNFS